MSNADLIERLRNAATFGTCLEAADALDLADKRIAEEREQHDIMMERGAEKLAEAERKLDVAREALRYAYEEAKGWYDESRGDVLVLPLVEEALAQIGGEDARS